MQKGTCRKIKHPQQKNVNRKEAKDGYNKNGLCIGSKNTRKKKVGRKKKQQILGEISKT